jgi:hypothetical protein
MMMMMMTTTGQSQSHTNRLSHACWIFNETESVALVIPQRHCYPRGAFVRVLNQDAWGAVELQLHTLLTSALCGDE